MADQAFEVPTDAKRLMVALDHLDAAYAAVQTVDARVRDHIHAAREQTKLQAGILIFQHNRKAFYEWQASE